MEQLLLYVIINLFNYVLQYNIFVLFLGASPKRGTPRKRKNEATVPPERPKRNKA